MKSQLLSTKGWGERITAALMFLTIGALIILVFSPWQPLIEIKVADYLGRAALTAVLLTVVAAATRNWRLENYRQVWAGPGSHHAKDQQHLGLDTFPCGYGYPDHAGYFLTTFLRHSG
jgi:hypothetical protein